MLLYVSSYETKKKKLTYNNTDSFGFIIGIFNYIPQER